MMGEKFDMFVILMSHTHTHVLLVHTLELTSINSSLPLEIYESLLQSALTIYTERLQGLQLIWNANPIERKSPAFSFLSLSVPLILPDDSLHQ